MGRHSNPTKVAPQVEGSLGTVVVGMQADLVVLRSSPAASIRKTRGVAFVVKRGRVIEVTPR